jgi:uncharacterized protein
MTVAPRPVQPLLATGQVRHARVWPRAHRFAYANYFWLLPMRQLRREPVQAVARNGRAALSFHDVDHGVGGPDALAWLDDLLVQVGLDVAALQQGEVWLQTYPRVLGFAFKPVSFWWVHDHTGALVAVVAEVNNTFGDRHAYVLHGPDLKLGREVCASKVFHVSPFCSVEGRYRFRFMRTGPWGAPTAGPDRVVVCIDHDDAQGPVLRTSQSGQLQALTVQSARHAFWAWPLMTWSVVVRIHWQALALWLKGIRLHRRPDVLPPSFSTNRLAPSAPERPARSDSSMVNS